MHVNGSEVVASSCARKSLAYKICLEPKTDLQKNGSKKKVKNTDKWKISKNSYHKVKCQVPETEELQVEEKKTS